MATSDRNRDRAHERHHRLRNDVIEAYGGRCEKCGYDNPLALQFDHIHGGGQKDRKQGREFYQRVLNDLLMVERTYRLLCANCNITQWRIVQMLRRL